VNHETHEMTRKVGIGASSMHPWLKRCWWLTLSLWVLGWTVGRAEEVLTIATYNVANYNLADRMTDGIYRREYPKPEREKAALRQVIHALQAEVLALQEMGPPPFLRELQRDLRREGLDYPFATVLDATGEPRSLAVLSRRPLILDRGHTDFDFVYQQGRETVRRGLLEVQVETAAGPLTLFVVHLKSRYTEQATDPGARELRAREAVAVRDRIISLFPEEETGRFLILGDFNSPVRERAVQAFLSRGQRTISHVLSAEDSRGERWTHFYEREDAYSRVDHVLVSPALRAAVVNDRARIYDGPGVREASDHRPVVVRLRLGKGSVSGEP
jgi:endonuclease/exonuclease/phosphatase family metal-dependent hydrolase